jgi:hypothetical protein
MVSEVLSIWIWSCFLEIYLIEFQQILFADSLQESHFYIVCKTSIITLDNLTLSIVETLYCISTGFIASANSVDPDQPEHLCYLIRIYTVRFLIY